jgi:hypothetical protein
LEKVEAVLPAAQEISPTELIEQGPFEVVKVKAEAEPVTV